MGTHNFGFPADSCQSTSDHLMGNCMGKYNQKIRRSDPAFHVCAGLAEHFCFTSVFPPRITTLIKTSRFKLAISNPEGCKNRRAKNTAVSYV